MKKNETMSGRERVRLALERRVTDRIPIAMVCSGIGPSAQRALEAHLQKERGIGVEQFFAPLVDIVDISPPFRGPALPDLADIWGVRRKPMSYGVGSYDEIEHYPLQGATIDEVRDYTWPDPDWFDYGAVRTAIEAARKSGDPCLMVSNGNLFERAWHLRGLEQMLMDMMDNEELVSQIMRRVTDFFLVYFRRILEVADDAIDLVFTADDIGGQRGPLMSPDKWRRLVVPFHQEQNRLIHEFGPKVIYHSDGAVMWALDGLVEMGIDVLQALQFDADGMDPAAMKRGWGDRLCFEGGVSVQATLPFGTPEEVIAEVRQRIEVLGRDGGYILGPSHRIQDGTPPENIAAMFDTARTYYPY